MSEKIFKKGDRVRCIDDEGHSWVKKGKEYTVHDVPGEWRDKSCITVEELGDDWIFASRFELVIEAPLNQQIQALEAQLATLRKQAIDESLVSLLDSAYATVKERLARGETQSDVYYFGVSPRVAITVQR